MFALTNEDMFTSNKYLKRAHMTNIHSMAQTLEHEEIPQYN